MKSKEPILVEQMYYTKNQYFTPKQVAENFGHLCNDLQLDILIGHLSEKQLCYDIYGAVIQDGIVFLGVGEEDNKELIAITPRNNQVG